MMRTALGAALAIVTLAFPAVAELDRTRFMGLEEVRPGMTGEGLSVFSSGGLESFRVRILDVIRNQGPKHDVILAELDGAVVNEAGIIQGMSGSPVYVDDRLVGAVAYGWSFAKRPIAGITPIEAMLAVMRSPEPEQELAALPAATAPLGGEALTAAFAGAGSPSGALRPIRVPVAASGLTTLGLESLSRAFEPLGLAVVQGVGGGGDESERPARLRAGDPVSIPLVRGDASIAVFGTVTYSDDERLVAFGHPVFHRAGQRLPMAGGRVLGVLPSQLQSFKFGAAGAPIGYFYSDQMPGAAGRYGDPPPMLPVSVVLEHGEETSRFAYEVARDREITPLLLQVISASTMATTLHQSGFGTLTTEVSVHLRDGTLVRHEDVLATTNAPELLGLLASTPLNALVGNPYTEPHLERIEIRTRLEDEVRISGIESVEVLPPIVRPGDRLDVELTLRPYRGELKRVRTTIDVPADADPGEAVLRVCDRVSFEEFDRERAPEKYRPRTYGQFIKRLQDYPAHNQIVLRLYAPGEALVIQGAELPSLPPSARFALGRVRASGKRSTADGVELATAMLELDEHVIGCHTISLELEER